jgi:glycosyltransferase involved in cell wall biosynthesis
VAEIGGQDQAVDVLLVGLGSTPGLRMADEALARALARAGARVRDVQAHAPRDVRTLMLTDLLWAHAARRSTAPALGHLRRTPRRPRAVIYSTTTAALLWPLPGAIRFDAPAAANRPGRHGLWQRALERRRLREAPLLLPWSEGGLAEACAAVPSCADRALILPAPIELPADTHDRSERDITAITYAGNPHKKGFDRVLDAWRRVRRPGERLVVVGIAREQLVAAGFELAGEDIHVTGSITSPELRGMLRRARVFICAPRREDYGLVQLEALAEGCQLVTTPAPGPYVALAIAHRLDPRLVSEDLGGALRAALDVPVPGYAARATELVEPFGRDAFDRLVAEQLLPRLLSSQEATAPGAGRR